VHANARRAYLTDGRRTLATPVPLLDAMFELEPEERARSLQLLREEDPRRRPTSRN
jgi:hypothetical protein